jgi:hypothetical protein
MANLYVVEYEDVLMYGNAVTQAPIVPELTTQKVAFTTSTASAAFNDRTRLVEITSDADCHLAFGAGTPAATTSKQLLKANTPKFFAVRGKGLKVAAVTAV